jgi:hypothetical protein
MPLTAQITFFLSTLAFSLHKTYNKRKAKEVCFMARKPVLVVMAAGMGSRYGGLKQIDPVGLCGEAILDYSLYDAYKAGFETVVIVIKEAIRDDFMSTVGQRLASSPLEIRYAFQELTALPEGFSVPEGRIKPFGTGHAVLCAREAVGDAPFAVINADDYYGRSAFQTMYNALCQAQDGQYFDYCMVGYYLKNTLSDHGGVARGACYVDTDGYLFGLKECIGIERCGDQARFPATDGGWEYLDLDMLISMNMFGFTPSLMAELETGFARFCGKELVENPQKAEFALPTEVSRLMMEGKARVKMLTTADRWYGVTYAADKPLVVAAIQRMTADGLYPNGLWK